jgi:hypothetical protein
MSIQNVSAAFLALGDASRDFRGDNEATRRRAAECASIVADALKRLADLPREHAAAADGDVSGDSRNSVYRRRPHEGIGAGDIGYSGATVELEKEGGQWVAKRLTDRWVT